MKRYAALVIVAVSLMFVSQSAGAVSVMPLVSPLNSPIDAPRTKHKTQLPEGDKAKAKSWALMFPWVAR